MLGAAHSVEAAGATTGFHFVKAVSEKPSYMVGKRNQFEPFCLFQPKQCEKSMLVLSTTLEGEVLWYMANSMFH